MTVRISQFEHNFEVFLDDIGDCAVAFDITEVEEGDTIADKSFCDFAVFHNGKHITYDISKAQYKFCEAQANLEMENLITQWKEEWECAFYD